MKNNRTNKKAFYFLLFLVGFSYAMVKVTTNVKKDIEPVHTPVPNVETCQTCGVQEISTDVLEDNYTESLNIAYIDESETIDITDNLRNQTEGSVLGVNCSNFKNSLSSIRVACTSSGGGINFSSGSPASSGGNILVTKDTKIELVKVTYPLALM